jgi:hypothetical protein
MKMLDDGIESRLQYCVQEAQSRFRVKPGAGALFNRATTAFMRELLTMVRPLDVQARDTELLARDDKALLAELMIQALQADPLSSKALRLRLQGQLALRRMLEQAGGAYTASEVADLLGITGDAVRKRARKGRLLAIPRGGHSLYPAFQFDVSVSTVVPGFEAILALLDTDSAAAKLRFFLTADSDLDGTPLAALLSGDEGLRDRVARSARQFGHQTAQ